jgi:Xaa-Pro aminopeptidase
MADELDYQRLQRVRVALAAAPFDIFVAASPANVFYATGYRSMAGQIVPDHRMAAIVTPDEVYLVGPCSDSAPALEHGIDPDHYVPFGRFYFESENGEAPPSAMADQHDGFVSALAAALKRAGAEHTVIGIDEVSLGGDALETIADRSSATNESTAWFHGLRARKLPGEVGKLRRAAELAESGIRAALAAASPGVSERELAWIVSSTMASGGGEPRFVVVTGGLRSALADAYPTDNSWKLGELMRFDIGCVVGGYWSDMARTAVLGEPDPTQARRYQALLAGLEAQFAEARAGTTAERLFDVALDTVRSQGIKHYRRQHCGHGIGAAVYESPLVAPDQRLELAPGMVMSLETPYYELGWGGMMVEDMVAIDEDGFTPLTHSPRELLTVQP